MSFGSGHQTKETVPKDFCKQAQTHPCWGRNSASPKKCEIDNGAEKSLLLSEMPHKTVRLLSP